MANSLMHDIDGSFGLTDCRASVAVSTGAGAQGGRTTATLTEDNNYSNINDLDTRLQAIDGTTYTQAYLRTMTKNDKVYALRLLTADAAGVK